MRFRDFKINEGSNLAPAELLKYGNDSPRVQAFLSKIQNQQPFDLVKGGQVIIDPSIYNDVKNSIMTGGKIPTLVSKDGQKITSSSLKKTAEFGGLAGKEGKVANKGEVAEGILGAATMARLLKRPGTPITVEEVHSIISKLPKNETGGKISEKAESDGITDQVDLVVRLKPATYADFINPQKWSIMLPIAKSIVKYVNDYVKSYATFFEKNGRPDIVEVVSDGVSNEVGSKTDVYMIYNDEKGQRRLQHFDLSAKTGTTMQLGQVGSGGKASSIEKRFELIKDLFGKFGIDITPIKDEFSKSNSLESSYVKAYEFAAKNIKEKLAGNKQDPEEAFLQQIVSGIKYFGTLNDDRVKLVQFTNNGYYVLDFKKLNRLYQNKDIDLDVKFYMGRSADGEELPKIQIIDTVTGKDLITIRMFRSSTGYIRNYIEKGKLLVQLAKVRGD